jgi:two-component system sensor histidine kinase ChvG
VAARTNGDAFRVGLGMLHRSFAARMVFLVMIFLAVPAIVYREFRDADAEKTALIEENARKEGELIAAALAPILQSFNGRNAEKLSDEVRRLGGGDTAIRLLLRPEVGGKEQGLFLIAAVPPLPSDRLEAERVRLVEAGAVAETGGGCLPYIADTRRYTNVSGQEEVLTAVTPVPSPQGCWLVLVSRSGNAVLRSSLGRPYWQSTEVRVASFIYAIIAMVVLWMFADIWGNLKRFARLARDIRTGDAGGRSFERQNRVPEISGIATEFDRLVLGLRASARSIREAAEENAHALKGPLAVIAQSVEPLKRLAASENEASRALSRIEQSTEKLDRLVSASRQLDNATAAILEAPRERVDFAALVESQCAELVRLHDDCELQLDFDGPGPFDVWGSAGLLETVVENLLDNAHGFSPPGGSISVRLARTPEAVLMAVADEGPGVADADLGRIFERYYTNRAPDEAETGEAHYGIGLWVVRRNVDALGGTIVARNLTDGGLQVEIAIPVAR